jgi:hypothetical protein
MLAFSLVAWLVGLGGWRSGALVVGAPLVLGGGALAFIALREVEGRIVWAAAVAVVGLSLTGLVGQRSPYSTGRLAQELDALDLPFFTVVSQVESGHGWCRPTCPAVTRVYRGPDTSAQAVMVTLGSALIARGLIRDTTALRDIAATDSVRVVTRDYSLRAGIERADATLRSRRITITVRSRRA